MIGSETKKNINSIVFSLQNFSKDFEISSGSIGLER